MSGPVLSNGTLTIRPLRTLRAESMSHTEQSDLCGQLLRLSREDAAVAELIQHFEAGGHSRDGLNCCPVFDCGEYYRPGNRAFIGITRFGISKIVVTSHTYDVWVRLSPEDINGRFDPTEIAQFARIKLEEIKRPPRKLSQVFDWLTAAFNR